MAVRITNLLLTSPIGMPNPIDDNIGPRETREYQYVEYDSLINDYRIRELVRKNVIRIVNLDDLVDYVSQWNQEPKLRLGGYTYWVDALGQLRQKFGEPTHDLDGVVIGPGGGVLPHGSTHVFDGSDPIPEIEVLETEWSCPATVSLRDTVYQTGASSVDKARANAAGTMPAVGVVRAKPTATTCIIARSGEVPGFTLAADTYYYVSASTAGAITNIPPSTSGNLIQQVGYAKTTSVLVVELSRPLKKA